MDKLKKVLNHSKDEPNLARSDSNQTTKSRRRASKVSSKGSKEAVEAVASPAAATGEPVAENSRRISIKTNVPVQVSERRPSVATPVSPAPIVTAESRKEATRRPSIVTPLSPATIAKTESQRVAAPVTHNVIKHRETEEVIKTRQHERNIHHVQHHVQPVKDIEVRDEIHHNRVAPVTAINETFKATAEDAAAYESLGEQFKDVVIHAEPEREIVDLGEEVKVQEHHHIHNVVQPVIQKETHDRHRIHTTVPIHHVTHEAPVIHESVKHEALSMEEYLKRGGSLNSNITHSDIGKVILTDQRVEGVASVTVDQLSKKPDAEKVDSEVPAKSKA